MRYLLLLCLLSLNAHAFTMSGKLVGEELTWYNARDVAGDAVVPNYWFKPMRLPETKRWVPGTYTTPSQFQIQLSSGSDTVSVPLKLTGVRYHPLKGYEKSPYSDTYPTCSRTDLGQFILVRSGGQGDFCIANSSIHYQEASPPFNKYQPSFELDKTRLIAALNGKPKGIYSGTVTAVFSYGFFAETSETVKTYRNIPMTFSIQINYSPSTIKRINVLGNGHITPEYDTYKHTVSGTTGFKISALGSFQNGLKFKLINKDANDYTLKPDRGGSTYIPYNISCQGCSSAPELVIDGSVVNEGKGQIEAPNSTMIPFMLKVGFKDVSVNDVEDKRYNDHFTVMFEVLL
ncbi:hypothetical protein [Shewanella nanhaiensis]|uniref:Fimbrial protein n=1 Tax=Shewanella nanhaiensis TaxID=2864872 RepID=A0ABS7DY13_9GAMM|nr:hypothetical protein [Shewanella nanhaiensis]MBW8182324.1 hypothetical protein [Shewanella nanhaiensis]